MAEPTVLIEIIKVVASGAVGAFSAILGQHIAARHAERRHALEMQQRERQMWAQFVSPVAARRIDAYEAIYDTVQTAIETGEIPMSDYINLRKRLMYLPSNLRDRTVTALSMVLAEKRANNSQGVTEANALLKEIQTDLECALGLKSLEDGLQQIGFTSNN